MRVAVDTNVLFAALTSTEGLCAGLLEVLLQEHTIVISEYILSELRKHLEGKRRLDQTLIHEQIGLLRSRAAVVEPVVVSFDTFPDSDDLPVLGTAIAGNADCLVTGDKAMLALERYATIPIIGPRALYERLCHQPPE